jgi:hypothetical protein
MKAHVMRRTLNCLLFALCTTVASAQAPAVPEVPQLVPGVRKIMYQGWKDSLVLESPDADVKVVVVPEVGGRIMEFSYDGNNIMWMSPDAPGRTMETHPKGFSSGGHQSDIGPELRTPVIARRNELFIGKYTGSTPRDLMVKVESAEHKATGVQLIRDVVLDPINGELGVLQTIKNISATNVSYCVWDRTLCKGGGFVFFPLAKKSRFPAKWSVRGEAEGKYFYDGINPQHENVKIIKNTLVAYCKGAPSKIGADSDAGWMAYVKGNLLFIKYFPHSSKGYYSDGGNTVEAYWNEHFAEIEPLSPEATILPGESYAFPEKWVLIELDSDIHTHQQAAELVKKIPAFKF